MVRSLLGIAGLVALASAPGCGSDPVAPPVPALGSVQEATARWDGLEVSLESAWPAWGITPAPGPRLDALGIRVLNRAAGARGFDPRAVRIETADGTYWHRVVVGADGELRPMTLEPLEDVFGWIVFRVPAGAAAVAIVWTPGAGLALRIPLPAPAK